MRSLDRLIDDLEKMIPFINSKHEVVSKVSVGWHIEHTLLAMVKMMSAVEHSNPAEFKSKFNFKRSLVLALGMIPRGKGGAPASVKPGELISEETILPLLEKARQKVKTFETLSSDKYFTHPVFGDLKLLKARKIVAIHTQHHIKIINDIVKV